MTRQAWLTLFVLVASTGCGGKELSSSNVDSGLLEASSEGGPTDDASSIECRSNSDCPGARSCGPDYPAGCEHPAQLCMGPYPPSFDELCACGPETICTMDSECDGGSVCREDPTVAPNCLRTTSGSVDGGLVCSTPCTTDSECAATDKCENGGHCLPRTCAECPSYFSCATGACFIPTCSTDKDCPGGYCVNGSCAGLLGTCTYECG